VKPWRRLLVALVVALLSAAAACGGGSATTPSTQATTSPKLTGSLTVLAAASLTGAFNTIKSQLQTSNPGLSIANSFAGSQQLVAQIQQGAPADVVATADTDTMNTLVKGSLVATPTVFARNLLEIAVAPGNPKGVKALSDLGNPALKVVLADPSVPAGKFARQALAKAGVTVNPVSNELDVKSVLQKVALGEADAGIVYVTDVKAAGNTVTGVAIAPADNVIATYPIAMVKATKNAGAAQAYINDVVSGPGQQVLRSQGFLSP
jgi:molybdate transport system substrate-binding protein